MTAAGIDAALARARAFVAAAGDALARTRLAAALGEAEARRALREALAARQGDDGAVARPGEAPGLAGTAAALVWLDEAGDLGSAVARRAAARLAAAQEADGAWTPPGCACAHGRIVATGLLAGLLARCAATRPATLRRAGDFLAAHWGPERVQGGDPGAIAGFASFFANVPHELSDAALQWCGRELERGVRTGRIDARSAARVLVLCDAHGLPGARLAPAELVRGLLAAQAGDGGWGDAGLPPAARVDATVEAATALRRLAGRR